jgi:hypothetical protein
VARAKRAALRAGRWRAVHGPFDRSGEARYIGIVVSVQRLIGVLLGCIVLHSAAASATCAMSRTTYTIYGLIDPRTNELYYIGRTRRNLVERTDEHFFEAAETPASPGRSAQRATASGTLVAKRNRAIRALGMVPGILKLGEAADAPAAFHAELYWIHFWTVQGKRLLNRETQPWFYERYEALFSPRVEGPKRQAAGQSPAPSAPKLQGAPWTEQEDTALVQKVQAGTALPEMAGSHQRSPQAIEQRLAKLRSAGKL